MSKDKALTGAAGEHYIAFQLSARGYAVGLTARGTSGADLLVTNLETGKSITVQVKTMLSDAFVESRKHGPYWKWRVGVFRTRPLATFYYLFVDLKGNLSKSPDVYVVQSLELEAKPPELKEPLLEQYPEENPRDAWCVIYDRDKDRFLNRWDAIRDALG